MLPLKDVNPTQSRPVVTIGLILANVIVFIYQIFLSRESEQTFVMQLGLIPYELTKGVDIPPYSPLPVYLNLFTSQFLHGGFWHIGGNMLYLWIFGNNVEDYLGKIRFILFYLGCGVVAGLTQTMLSPNSEIPMVGASGAISGILGSYLVLFPRSRVLTLVFLFYFIRLIELPAVILLGFWFIIQIFSGAGSLAVRDSGGVAWFAHIGGFIIGWILTRFYFKYLPPYGFRRDFFD